MATLNGTTLEVVVNILGSEPSQSLNPYIWQEIIKIRNAIRELAGTIDYIKSIPKQTITPVTTGNLTHSLFLGGLTTVNVIAGQAITPSYYPYGWGMNSPIPVKFVPTASGIRAYKVGVELCDGYSIGTVAAGVVGSFILRGLATQSRQLAFPRGRFRGADDWYEIYPHGRLSMDSVYPDLLGCQGYYGIKLYYSTDYHNDWPFIGTDIGVVGDSSYYAAYGVNALIYFNPRRA